MALTTVARGIAVVVGLIGSLFDCIARGRGECRQAIETAEDNRCCGHQSSRSVGPPCARDMPVGYAADPTDAATSSQPNGTTGICSSSNGVPGAQAVGVAGFVLIVLTEFAQNPTLGPFLTQAVFSFPGAKRGAPAFMSASQAQIACGSWSTAATGQPTNYTVSQVAFPNVANSTIAYRVTSAGANSPEVGGRRRHPGPSWHKVVVVSSGGLGGPDATLEEKYIGKATSKLGVTARSLGRSKSRQRRS
jgi:hypothetical protein